MSTRYVCAMAGHTPPLVFDLRDADLLGCVRASVQDVLEHAAEHHHVECGCSLRIGGRVLISSTPLSDGEDNCYSTMMQRDPLPVNAVLEDLCPASKESTLYLVLSSDKAPSEDYLRLYREKAFISSCVNDARVFIRAGCKPTLPPRIPGSFEVLGSTPGAIFVDKSKVLHAALHLFSSSRVNIVRRPKGFGKTAFLSMMHAFFDPLSAHAYFPFTFTEDMSGLVFRAQHRLLVFALDLEDLVFTPTMSPDELEAECDRLMNAASQQFYARYRDLLCVSEQETSRAGFSPTFLHLIRWTKSQGWHLFFTIDNYTAPLLGGHNWSYELSISKDIFARLSSLLPSGFIRYGLIVGEDVPHGSDGIDLPGPFTDLSDESQLYDAMGFTLDEVIALGQAISIDLIAALPPGTPTGRYARRVYAAEDIIALARSLTSPDGQGHAPTKVRTMKFKHPPPPAVSVAVEPEHFEWDASDDARINEEIVANLFGPLSDEEDGVDADAPRSTNGPSCPASSDGKAEVPITLVDPIGNLRQEVLGRA